MTHSAIRSVLALLVTLAGLPVSAADRFEVTERLVEDRKSVFATVESVRETEARARIAGTLRALAVREGDAVAAGTVIARVEDPKLALQQAAIDARLDAFAAQRRQAQLDLNRTRQLRSTGAATQARLDEVQTALDVVAAEAAAARAERAVIDQQRTEGDILAPQAGRVLSVRGVEGGVVMPGEPIATIATDTYVLRLRLPERHARFMRTGDSVQVGARGLGHRPEAALGEGRITLVYPRLENGQVIADAEVTGLGDFFVGERVEVTIVADRRQAVVVPRRFVRHGAGVDLVTLENGRIVPVQTGPDSSLDDGPGIEILSGLRAGDVIVAP